MVQPCRQTDNEQNCCGVAPRVIRSQVKLNVRIVTQIMNHVCTKGGKNHAQLLWCCTLTQDVYVRAAVRALSKHRHERSAITVQIISSEVHQNKLPTVTIKKNSIFRHLLFFFCTWSQESQQNRPKLSARSLDLNKVPLVTSQASLLCLTGRKLLQP